MKTSAAGIERIKRYESCVLHIYKDQADLDTIGVGHLITTTEHAVPTLMALYRAEISQGQADALLALDLAPAEGAVSSLVKILLTQEQVDSLVSFVFNVGASAFAGSSLLKALNANAPHAEIRADFLKWSKVHVDGKLVESAGLKTRRTDEAKAFS